MSTPSVKLAQSIERLELFNSELIRVRARLLKAWRAYDIDPPSAELDQFLRLLSVHGSPTQCGRIAMRMRQLKQRARVRKQEGFGW